GVDAGRRIRLPDPDHGLQAVRPAGRGDEGGGMTTTASEPETGQMPPERPRRFTMPAGAEKAFIPVFFVLLILLPFALDSGGELMGSAVLALAYVGMALGLTTRAGL